MTPNKLMTVSLGIGAGAATFALTSASALAITLTPTTPTPDWTNLGWAAEGRAGAAGFEDYEFAIGPDGAQDNNTGQIYSDWTSTEDLAWSLDWDKITQKASFTVAGESISYSVSDPGSTFFDGFYLLTRTQTQDGMVDPGTSMFLSVDRVNGEAIAPVFSESVAPATSGTQDLNQFFFASDTEISSLGGIARLSWDDLDPNGAAARSRVSFKIRGFDTGNRGSTLPPSESVPEPAAILGLLGISAYLMGSVRQCKSI